MLRTIFILPLFAAVTIYSLAAPFAGVLGWTWITLMTPQQLVWGSLATFPINMVLAITTLIGWFLSSEPKRFPVNLVTAVWFCFVAYMTFTTFFALAPDISWVRWDRTIKVMALGFVIAAMATNQIRVHALVWVIVLSLAYFGVKGGVFTLTTGGSSRVMGAQSSGLDDNNYLALALCTIIPLMNYLRMHSEWRATRIGAMVAMGFVVVGVIGTYSRGGLVGLAITCGYLWWKSRQKVLIAAVGLIVLIPAIQFMPESWHMRMSTIETAEQDSSFQARLQAWQFAINAASNRPLTGVGFSGTENTAVFNTYYHDPSGDRIQGHAAHSIYFQVLGDHGFVGLALYIAMLMTTWWYMAVIRRTARRRPEFEWAGDLAAMMQVSLIAFMVAGAALSMAYYDILYLLMGMSIALRDMILHYETAQLKTQSRLVPGISPARPAGADTAPRAGFRDLNVGF